MAFATVNFYSLSLLRTVDINVVIPTDKHLDGTASIASKEPCKTLYLLHGLFGDHNDWVHGTRVQALANNYGLCVVMPNGDNSFYVDTPGYGRKYSSFLLELVEFTRNTFSLSDKRENTYIGGLSMGGFGSLINGLLFPEIFSRVCAFSSALIKQLIVDSVDLKPEDRMLHDMSPKEYAATFGVSDVSKYPGSQWDYDVIAEKMAKKNQKPLIYMSCGKDDGLFPVNVEFKNRLVSLGFDVTWDEGPGEHDWDYWDECIEKIMQWLPLGSAVKGISSEHVL